MASQNEQAKIIIGDNEYLIEDLPESAKAHVVNIQFVDTQLQQLHNEWAVADTARIGYTNALKNEISKSNDSEKA